MGAGSPSRGTRRGLGRPAVPHFAIPSLCKGPRTVSVPRYCRDRRRHSASLQEGVTLGTMMGEQSGAKPWPNQSTHSSGPQSPRKTGFSLPSGTIYINQSTVQPRETKLPETITVHEPQFPQLHQNTRIRCVSSKTCGSAPAPP